jgi:hypothetical protein
MGLVSIGFGLDRFIAPAVYLFVLHGREMHCVLCIALQCAKCLVRVIQGKNSLDKNAEAR